MYSNRVRHHKARQQANTEAADVIVWNLSINQLSLGGLPDYSQETVDLLQGFLHIHLLISSEFKTAIHLLFLPLF